MELWQTSSFLSGTVDYFQSVKTVNDLLKAAHLE
jgi:hypothetical protein